MQYSIPRTHLFVGLALFLSPVSYASASCMFPAACFEVRGSIQQCREITKDNQRFLELSLANTVIGKFCSIAQGARINPGNHATWRAAQHHFTYMSEGVRILGVDPAVGEAADPEDAAARWGWPWSTPPTRNKSSGRQ